MSYKNETFDEAKVTNKNLKSDVMGATVIANYGDPGLDENYFADILSRYVICVLDSPLRTLHYNTWSKDMIIIVKRPETLWIDYEGAFSEDISVNRKIDYSGNISIGKASSYSYEGIARINYPYEIGEKIKVIKTEPQDILYSKTPSVHLSKGYEKWHSKGLVLVQTYGGTEEALRTNTLSLINKINNSNSEYGVRFHKYQYEAAILSIYNNEALRNFFQSQSSSRAYFSDQTNKGGYLFKSIEGGPILFPPFSLDFNSFVYEDINVNSKSRTANSSCLPLVVTSPNSFSAPKIRSPGTINYNPTYIPYVGTPSGPGGGE